MKKIVLVRLDKACDPEVESLKDVVEFVKKVAASEEVCERESKKEELSEGALELISAIAKDLGIDVEQLKKDIIEEKHAAEAKAKEALKKTQEAARAEEKDTEIRVRNAIYYSGVKDGYEKGFHDVVNFMKSRLGKFIEDLDDMSKWSFKNGKLKDDTIAILKK